MGELSVPRRDATTTALADGRVLVAGGFGPTFAPAVSGTFEVYDPLTQTFGGGSGALATPRALHRATALADGRVLLTGGVDGNGNTLAACELFDPATTTSAASAAMSFARAHHTATLLADGRVLVTGGTVDEAGGNHYVALAGALSDAEIYDPGDRHVERRAGARGRRVRASGEPAGRRARPRHGRAEHGSTPGACAC